MYLKNAALSNLFWMLKDTVSLIMIKKEDTFQFVTKHVFFKYYPKRVHRFSFWGETDRRDYAEALNEKNFTPYYKQDNNDTTIPNLTNGNYDTEESDF